MYVETFYEINQSKFFTNMVYHWYITSSLASNALVQLSTLNNNYRLGGPYIVGSSGGGGCGLGYSRGTSGTGYSYPSVTVLGGGWKSGLFSVSASLITGSTGGSYGLGVGFVPSTQVSAQLSKQQRPLFGQSEIGKKVGF